MEISIELSGIEIFEKISKNERNITEDFIF